MDIWCETTANSQNFNANRLRMDVTAYLRICFAVLAQNHGMFHSMYISDRPTRRHIVARKVANAFRILLNVSTAKTGCCARSRSHSTRELPGDVSLNERIVRKLPYRSSAKR